jgi:hypothetical protein
MNYILIFKNDENLSGCDQIDINNLPRNPVKFNNTILYLFNDEIIDVEIIKKKFLKVLNQKDNTFFIVLHRTTQENCKSAFIKEFGPNVICQSNVGGEFYFTIIPKLILGNLTFEDIKTFFPDPILNTKLCLLHKLLGGEFDLDESEMSFISKYNFQFDNYKKIFNDNTGKKLLREFRDQLLQDY